MKIHTTGNTAKILGIGKDKLFYLEETGKIPAAQRTSSGKRFYTTGDIQKLKSQLIHLGYLTAGK